MSSPPEQDAPLEIIPILTIRLIKSFEYRTFKNLLLRDIPSSWTIAQLKAKALEQKAVSAGFKPFANVEFDTMKMYTQAHGSKTSNLIINLNHPEWLLKDEDILSDLDFRNETEVSFFHGADYEAFLEHQEIKW